MKFGFVYLIDSGEYYKIGASLNPEKRLRQLKTGSSRPLKMIHWLYSSRYREVEKKLHDRFASKRVSGEWFNLCGYDVEYIKSLNYLGNSPREQLRADQRKAARLASYR